MWYRLDENRKTVKLSETEAMLNPHYHSIEYRKTARDEVADPEGGAPIAVSTVFLGLEHGHDGQGRPLLWETMVFGGAMDEFQDRYATEPDAIRGHVEVFRKVRKLAKGLAE